MDTEENAMNNIKLKPHELIRQERLWIDTEIANGGVCVKCGRKDSEAIRLTLDHIIPDDIVRQFGIDPKQTWNPENVQLYCKVCNQFKANKLDFSNPKTKPLLLELIALI